MTTIRTSAHDKAKSAHPAVKVACHPLNHPMIPTTAAVAAVTGAISTPAPRAKPRRRR